MERKWEEAKKATEWKFNEYLYEELLNIFSLLSCEKKNFIEKCYWKVLMDDFPCVENDIFIAHLSNCRNDENKTWLCIVDYISPNPFIAFYLQKI